MDVAVWDRETFWQKGESGCPFGSLHNNRVADRTEKLVMEVGKVRCTECESCCFILRKVRVAISCFDG